MLTSEQLKEIRERAEKATPGPWTKFDRRGGCEIDAICHIAWCGEATCVGRDENGVQYAQSTGLADTRHNGKFIAHSRTDIPALLSHIEEVEARVKHLEEVHAMIREALPGPMYVDQLLNAVMASRPVDAKSVIKAYFADITKIVDEAKT